MKPKVIFVVPPSGALTVFYPIGLAYIAAVLKKNGYACGIMDFRKGNVGLDAAVNLIAQERPDVLGLSVYTFSYTLVKKMISKIKIKLPGIKVIIGGPHASVLPGLSLEDLGADFVVVGEGEHVVPELLKRIGEGDHHFEDLPGVGFWREGKPFVSPGINIIDDLDALPFPVYGLDSIATYKATTGLVYRPPCSPVLTSRGCPQRCGFCASHRVHGRVVRKRNPGSVVDEIELLVKRYGVKTIGFLDDTLTEDKEHAFKICEEIIRRRIHIHWKPAAGVRLDTLDNDLLKVFKASGCYQLPLGIESFSDEVLKRMHKPVTKKYIGEKIKDIKRHGISAMGFFIFGFPGETASSLTETIDAARHSALDWAVFFHVVPLPGSEIFDNRYSRDDVKKMDWDKFYFFASEPFDLSGIPPRTLRRAFIRAYLYFYSTPRRVVLVLRHLLSQRANIPKSFKLMSYILRNALSNVSRRRKR